MGSVDRASIILTGFQRDNGVDVLMNNPFFCNVERVEIGQPANAHETVTERQRETIRYDC